ncbi:MAG: universal stress protein [Chloroflexi bacterium]|nr:universal stress protein [Chloroflexota bacterium]
MYNKILVPLDGSPEAECVIPHLETIAKTGVHEIELITVVEPFEMPTRGRIALNEDDLKRIDLEAKSEAHKYLNQVVERLTRSGLKVHPVILTGKPAESLIDYIDSNNIDLLIMATHGRSGITRLFWGSVAEKVLRSVNVPVLLVKNPACE